MKRAAALLVLAAFLLCGCSAPSATGSQDLDMDRIAAAAAPRLGSSSSAQVVEGTGVYPQWDDSGALDAAEMESSFIQEDGNGLILLTVSQQTKTAETKAGTTAFTRRCDEVALRSDWYPDQAEQINDQIDTYLLRHLDQAESQEAAALEAAQAADEAGQTFYGWTSYSDVAAQRMDESYVSVLIYNSVYLGGAHPSNEQVAMNFDTATGTLLSLSRIFRTECKDSILKLLLSRLKEMESSFQLFSGYQSTVQEKFEQMPADMTQNWFLTDRGITFFYNPYEISPYASGVVAVELNYAELSGYLRADFVLPDRSQQGDNSVLVTTDTGSLKGGDYDNLLEVSQGKGQEIALTVDGEIRNLRVTQVQLTGGAVASSDLILAVNRLTDRDAVVLSLSTDSGSGQSTSGFEVTYDIAYHQTVTQTYSLEQDGPVLIADAVLNVAK